MKRHLFGTVSALLVVGMMAGCATDPTKDLRGGVVTVLVSRTFVDLNVGQVLRMNAKALDAQGNVLPILPTITTSDAAVVSVTIDDTTSGDPLPETDFQIAAVSPGSATITATAGGVTSDPTLILSFPTSFPGAVATAASGSGWDVITVSATAAVKFDPDNTTATIAGAEAFIKSITADELQLVHSGADAVAGGALVIANLVFLGEYDIASLATTVNVSAFQNLATNDPATAPTLAPAAYPYEYYVYVTSGDPDMFAQLVGALDVTATFDWVTGADIDILWCNEACSGYVGNFNGASSAHPEVSSVSIPAATTWNLWTNLYDGEDTMVKVTLTSP